MKKLLITCLLLTFICLPVLSSCSKEEEICRVCAANRGSHIIISLGLKEGETKTFDYSLKGEETEGLIVTTEYHIADQGSVSRFAKYYGQDLWDCYAIVADYNKPKEEIPTPKVIGGAVSVNEVCEMAFRDNYIKKVHVVDGGVYKYYKKALYVMLLETFLEGEHFFRIMGSQAWWEERLNSSGYYYKREGTIVQIREQTELENWGENYFDREAEKEFWKNYHPYDCVI